MKQSSLLNFFVRLLILSLAVYGLLVLLFTKVWVNPAMPNELMVLVLLVVTGTSYLVVVKTGDKNPNTFTRSYMSTSSLRLILYSIFAIVYCFGHRDIAKTFVATFFILYIVYTIFEVKSVLSYFKKK